MLVHAAEQSYQKGIELLSSGRNREAQAYFRAALEIEKRFGIDVPQARYLSFYGLSVGLTGGDLHDAVRCCRRALEHEGYRPEICWNLGRVLLMAERRRDAFRAFSAGLRLQPDHPGLVRDVKRMGIRRRPVIPFLDRRSPINVFLGRLLAGQMV